MTDLICSILHSVFNRPFRGIHMKDRQKKFFETTLEKEKEILFPQNVLLLQMPITLREERYTQTQKKLSMRF